MGPPALPPEVTWVAATRSPSPSGDAEPSPLERAALARCGDSEAGLRETARAIVGEKLLGRPLQGPDWIAFVQRASGEPHPWPRVWAATARGLAADATLPKLDDWLAQSGDAHVRRCGVASGTGADGRGVLVVVAVEALADVSPLPTRARTGQWLTIEARMRVRAHGGAVFVLGPGGTPRKVPAWFDGKTLRARFALDRPGEFTVQVVADTAAGPRPVIEASVFADVEPPRYPTDEPAPGEDCEVPTRDDAELLGWMLRAARASAGLPSLTRDPRLDAVAQQHARRMAIEQTLAHDAGDGDPAQRMRSAGLEARDEGENVAHAPTIAGAHRALWSSPSHRANILRPDFERTGLGVARDDHGEAWVVEEFSGRP